MFCVVGNSINTSSLLASRSSIFAPIFISCNGGVRSYPPFLSSLPPRVFRPATVVSEVGSVGKVTRIGFFFLHCLLFVASKPDQTGEMDPSPDTAFSAQATPPAPVQATPPVVVLTREVDIRKFFGDDSTRAQEFKEDIRRALDAQPTLSSRRRLDLILSNVVPKVKAEVCCLEADVQTDHEQVVAAIVQSFGVSRSSSILLQALLITTTGKERASATTLTGLRRPKTS